jgi:hypothetical protein
MACVYYVRKDRVTAPSVTVELIDRVSWNLVPASCRFWIPYRLWHQHGGSHLNDSKCRRLVSVRFALEEAMKAQTGEYRYSSALSLTSALDGVGGQRHAPAVLPPRMTRYPLNRRLGGPPGRSGRVRRTSPPPGFDPRTVQPVTSLSTDWTIPAHFSINVTSKIM